MVYNFPGLQCLQFYKFSHYFYCLCVDYNKQSEKYYVDITGKFTFNKLSKTNEGFAASYLNKTAAAELVKKLPGAYQFTKNLETNKV